MTFSFIEGGVCAPNGFRAGGIHCGIKTTKEKVKDLAMIVSDKSCSAAGVFTRNKIKGAPILVTKDNIKDGSAKAIICNSGNANTCASNGINISKDICKLTSNALNCDSSDVIVASTGVIGKPLSIDPFVKGIPQLVKCINYYGSSEAASAIMTTDTIKKETAVVFEIGGKECKLGGITKGSGMIHPNMATTLTFLTTDVSISSKMLQKALSSDVRDTFNQVSVDGDTSTNDMVVIIANGAAGNKEIVAEGPEFDIFCLALRKVTEFLAIKLASDGEGASRLIICKVSKALNKDEARIISKSVISSNLFKAAIFGKDANWGRVLCAIGYAKTKSSVNNIDVALSSKYGRIIVCKKSTFFPYNVVKAEKVLDAKEIMVDINMNEGEECAYAWGCDLTFDYVNINSHYRN